MSNPGQNCPATLSGNPAKTTVQSSCLTRQTKHLGSQKVLFCAVRVVTETIPLLGEKYQNYVIHFSDINVHLLHLLIKQIF